jgi:hypothetical protein
MFTNQIRMMIGVMFGSPETTSGGNALKFYSSVRMDIRRIAAIKEGETVTGSRTKVKVVKNKVAAPFRTCEFDIIYGEGISFEGDVIDIASATGVDIIKKSGTWFAYNDERLGQGKESARKFLREHPAMANEIAARVRAHFDATPSRSPGGSGRSRPPGAAMVAETPRRRPAGGQSAQGPVIACAAVVVDARDHRENRPGTVWIRLGAVCHSEAAARACVVGATVSDDDIARLDRMDQFVRGRDRPCACWPRAPLAARDRTLRTLESPRAVRRASSKAEEGRVDDTRFAREFVSVRDTRRVDHIACADLNKLGLHRAVVDKALASYGADEQEALARVLVERTVRGGIIDEKTVRRVVGLLKRKGYDYSVVNRVAYELARKIPRTPDADTTDNIPEEW